MNNDLISRDALIKAVEDLYEYAELGEVLDVIKEAPAVELTETEIQEILNKRCMSAVANEYLIALHGKRPRGEWVEDVEPFGYDETAVAVCSVCRHSFILDEYTLDDVRLMFKYCPHCGALMTASGNNETE